MPQLWWRWIHRQDPPQAAVPRVRPVSRDVEQDLVHAIRLGLESKPEDLAMLGRVYMRRFRDKPHLHDQLQAILDDHGWLPGNILRHR